MVPFDTQSPFITSGIRLGTPAITTRGVKEKEICLIVNFIDEVLININNHKKIKQIKTEINKLMTSFPIFNE